MYSSVFEFAGWRISWPGSKQEEHQGPLSSGPENIPGARKVLQPVRCGIQLEASGGQGQKLAKTRPGLPAEKASRPRRESWQSQLQTPVWQEKSASKVCEKAAGRTFRHTNHEASKFDNPEKWLQKVSLVMHLSDS